MAERRVCQSLDEGGRFARGCEESRPKRRLHGYGRLYDEGPVVLPQPGVELEPAGDVAPARRAAALVDRPRGLRGAEGPRGRRPPCYFPEVQVLLEGAPQGGGELIDW